VRACGKVCERMSACACVCAIVSVSVRACQPGAKRPRLPEPPRPRGEGDGSACARAVGVRASGVASRWRVGVRGAAVTLPREPGEGEGGIGCPRK
jgi:hypothetical protein